MDDVITRAQIWKQVEYLMEEQKRTTGDYGHPTWALVESMMLWVRYEYENKRRQDSGAEGYYVG